MEHDEDYRPSAPSPEEQAAIKRERQPRALNLSELLVLEKCRHWLSELHALTAPRGFHRSRPKRESLRTRITGLLETMREFESGGPSEENP
jgi:hypothetical protein